MLKDKTLTYISLFSCAGVGCFGFKKAGYECIATNELIEKRLNVQRFNNKCRYESGYICNDITTDETKEKIFTEIKKWEKIGNDRVDVVIATPPCQGMSVANHKKAENEIVRNSLVVESIHLIQKIKPRFFIFENVAAFMKTGCNSPDGMIKSIGDVIYEELSDKYTIASRILNFKNYGSNSSRTRTVVIGVCRELSEYVAPIELYPNYVEEKSLKQVIGDMPKLEWGEICSTDFYHAFRTYPEKMRCWIHDLKEGESAFDNEDELKRPHKVVEGKIVPNIRKNGDKYTRQYWNKVAPCIHTRNDQLASQNTIHPEEDRVFSIRELMKMMTIPSEFKWIDKSLCTFEEHMTFVADEMEKVIREYGEFIKKGTYFNNSSVSKYDAVKIASDIKYKCNEYQIQFYVDVETYDIDYKNSCLVKRDSYDWRSVEWLVKLKDWIIKDVPSFIEEARAEKIKEIDECIDNLKLEREKFLPNVI